MFHVKHRQSVPDLLDLAGRTRKDGAVSSTVGDAEPPEGVTTPPAAGQEQRWNPDGLVSGSGSGGELTDPERVGGTPPSMSEEADPIMDLPPDLVNRVVPPSRP